MGRDSGGDAAATSDEALSGPPPELSVVVPAYQEAGTITEAMTRLAKALLHTGRSFEIIVVSDGSTDGTVHAARAAGIPELRVEHYAPNAGKGHALTVGVGLSRAEVVAFCDADLDLSPARLPELWELMELTGADAAVGSKVHPDSVVVYPRFRRFQSWVFRRLIQAVFDLDLSDTQTGLKVFRRGVLDEVLPKITTSGFAFDLELLVLANDAGYRVVEGPIDLDYDFTTTTGTRAAFDALRDVVRIAVLRRRRRHQEQSRRP
jgi:glycosyltransferase involved in cell wall biosynthesis